MPTLLLIITSTISLPLPVIVSIFQLPILKTSTCFFSHSRGQYCGTPHPFLTVAESCTCTSPAGNAGASVCELPDPFMIGTKIFIAGCPFLSPTVSISLGLGLAPEIAWIDYSRGWVMVVSTCDMLNYVGLCSN